MRVLATTLVFFTSIVYCQIADFLIVEDPSALTIYNKYQQSISDQIQNQFVPFTPFQIIEQDELLTDQISHASRVLFEDDIYFILKEDEDNYISDKNEYYGLFENCKLLGDTIKILRNNRVSIFSKPIYLYNKNQHMYLDENQNCIRIFKYKNLYYLKMPGDSTVFGWSQLPRNGWEVSHGSQLSLHVIPDNLVSRLKIRVDAANQDYENFFGYFGKKYNTENRIPYWDIEITDYEIQGTLNDPSFAENLKNSNRYLMQDIDNLFLGSNFTLMYTDSTFFVKPISRHR
ncbi:MAG: hypothetical protein P8Y99_07365 [Calditrichaceae bacterium]